MFSIFLGHFWCRRDLQALAADQERKSAGFHKAPQSPGTHSQERRREPSGNSLVPLFHPKSLSAGLPPSFSTYLWADILQKASESIALSNETLSSTRQPVLIYGNHPSELLFCVFLDRQTVSCMCL